MDDLLESVRRRVSRQIEDAILDSTYDTYSSSSPPWDDSDPPTADQILDDIHRLSEMVDADLQRQPFQPSLHPSLVPSLAPSFPIHVTPLLPRHIDYSSSPWYVRLRLWWERRLRRLGAEIPWTPLPLVNDDALFVRGLGLFVSQGTYDGIVKANVV